MRDARVDGGRLEGIVATAKGDIGGVTREKKGVRLANLPLRSAAALVVDGVLLRPKRRLRHIPGPLEAQQIFVVSKILGKEDTP